MSSPHREGRLGVSAACFPDHMFPTAPRTRALILSRPIVASILAAGFVLIFTTALLTAFSTRGAAVGDHQTAQAQHALAAASQFATSLAEAAAAAHDSRLTHSESEATRFAAKREQALAELATLARHFEAEPSLAGLSTQLEQRAKTYFAGLDETIRAAAASGEPASPAAATRDSVELQRVGHEIRELLATLQRNQFIALAKSSAAAASRAETIQFLNLGLISIGGLLAAAVCIWLLRRVRDLEGLITVCAWTRRVQWEGQWLSFEEYLAKRFNIYCTHGICEEAAEKMKQEAANTPLPADFMQ